VSEDGPIVDTRSDYGGTIPEYYDGCLGPAWFGAFAADLVQRLPDGGAGDVLEIACGTGLVTRRLRDRIDGARRLVASDVSPAMLEYARKELGDRPGIEWRQADAGRLPFGAGEFGAAVCAFGLMFVPDKRAAFREARRVLKGCGTFLFNVWDRIEDNPAATINAEVIEGLFPGDAEVRFRTPYEMHDPESLRGLLHEAGFGEERIEKKRIQVDGISARRVGGADPWRGPASAVVVEARAGASR
jgi:ubiquinone/menaquinone biosynthesis C-methylase UbiE